MLTIEAHNSHLAQILDDVSRKSGMIIEGNLRDSRVYGNYGPQDPSAVLSELLAGLGYNIMMVGTGSGGAPRKLILSSRAGAPSPPLPEKATEKDRENTPENIEAPKLGPGAIAHPPPSPPDDPHVRIEQNLQKLQQMRDPQNMQTGPP
jgi:hypothetical protein